MSYPVPSDPFADFKDRYRCREVDCVAPFVPALLRVEPDLARCFRGGSVAVAGHSSPEITWRVYSYLMASDEDAGRAAMGRTMSALLADVYPMCTP